MDKKQLSKTIYEYIAANKDASYVEIQRVFENKGFDYRGDREAIAGTNENIVFWSGWNDEAFQIIDDLIKSGKIERVPCHFIVYLIDGCCLTYPILRSSPKKIKSPHWIPCVFRAR